MKLVKKDEPLIVTTIKLLIYGEPGCGKTSIGSSAKNSILFDFDNGAHRTRFRGDIFQISRWEEVVRLSDRDIEEYETIVIDTAGRALDMIIAYLQRNGKNLTSQSGIPNQRGWGEAKAVFSGFLRKLNSFGKDVVILAHARKDRDDDMIINGPDVQGGSMAEIVKQVDQAGFLNMVNGSRFIDFTPSLRHLGKDSAGVGKIPVTSLDDDPYFLAGIITATKDAINSASEANRKATLLVEEFKQRIKVAESAEDFNILADEISKSPVKDRVRQIFVNATKNASLVFDKNTQDYKEAVPKREPSWYYEQADNLKTAARGHDLLSELDSDVAIKSDKQEEIRDYISGKIAELEPTI